MIDKLSSELNDLKSSIYFTKKVLEDKIDKAES